MGGIDPLYVFKVVKSVYWRFRGIRLIGGRSALQWPLLLMRTCLVLTKPRPYFCSTRNILVVLFYVYFKKKREQGRQKEDITG